MLYPLLIWFLLRVKSCRKWPSIYSWIDSTRSSFSVVRYTQSICLCMDAGSRTTQTLVLADCWLRIHEIVYLPSAWFAGCNLYASRQHYKMINEYSGDISSVTNESFSSTPYHWNIDQIVSSIRSVIFRKIIFLIRVFHV